MHNSTLDANLSPFFTGLESSVTTRGPFINGLESYVTARGPFIDYIITWEI